MQLTLQNYTETQMIEINECKNYENSVGNNLQSIQITTKYRYKMMRKDLIATYCKVAIVESCKRHKIELVIVKVMAEHVHLIVDCPRTMAIDKMMQIIKGLSSYLIFRLCPAIRKRYRKGNFWNRENFQKNFRGAQKSLISDMKDIFVQVAEVILKEHWRM